MGGYCLAVRAGSPDAEARLAELAADPEGRTSRSATLDDVRRLTSGWTDELARLLERCWPGPLEVFVSAAGGGAMGAGRGRRSESPAPGRPSSGMPEGRALRQLCREHGPWRTVPLRFTEAGEVAQAFGAATSRCVVDGGRATGRRPTVVDATVSPIRVLREGALPATFIEGTMVMSTRRRWFSRRSPCRPAEAPSRAASHRAAARRPQGADRALAPPSGCGARGQRSTTGGRSSA